MKAQAMTMEQLRPMLSLKEASVKKRMDICDEQIEIREKELEMLKNTRKILEKRLDNDIFWRILPIQPPTK